MFSPQNSLLRLSEIFQELLPRRIDISGSSVVFLDLDDVLLEPPYEFIVKLCKEQGITPPTRDQIVNREKANWLESFPELLPNKRAYIQVLLKGYIAGAYSRQPLFKEHDFYRLREVLKSPDVILLTKFPKVFSAQRRSYLEQLFRIDLTGRYISCGGLLTQGPSKGKVIQCVCKKNGISPGSCYLIDDSSREIAKALDLGVQGILVERSWNKTKDYQHVSLQNLVALLEFLIVDE